MNEVEQLAQEFYNVFKAVEEVIPDLSKYFLSAQQTSWLPLKKSGSVSMRDYILIKWSESQQQKKAHLNKDLLLTCALSFDVVSRANHFDVDHFFPQSEMMKNLDSLLINQKLLKKIKKQLVKLLKTDKESGGISNKEAEIYANNVVGKLIPIQDKQLLVTGLNHIYYNYPANLWPISGPVNRSKGKKESIDSAMSFVFARIESLLGDQNSKKLAIKTAKYLEVKEEKIKWDTDYNKQESIALLRKGILKKFYDNCNSSNITKSILPYYKDVTEIVSMLTFFKPHL